MASWQSVCKILICLSVLASPLRMAHADQPSQPKHEQNIIDRSDLVAIFDKYGVKGTFALLEGNRGRLQVVNRQRAFTRMVPASTFKIANSLIALETQAVRDLEMIIPYGGKPQPFDAWERDMNMREAIAVSNVPVYQEIAQRVGIDRYKKWLRRLGYGNQDPGASVTTFWLDGPLKISPVEQAKFVAKLARLQLPATTRNQQAVKSIIEMEASSSARLFGKTGWQFSAQPQLGWWVGWIEQHGRITSFALVIDIIDKRDIKKRIPLGKDLLAALGITL